MPTKFYKPNNSTILYLNSSFNCYKSSSITIAIQNGGSGYSSAPTLTVVSASGDNGYGATATCTVSGGVVNTITITNNGQNYNTLPTIQVSGGGGSGAQFTPSFLKTYKYTWNVPDIVINDLGKLSAINIVSTGFNSTTPYIYRINNILYDSRDSFFSDYGSPILSIAQNTNVCSYGSLGGTNFAIILSPQVIRQIIISVDDSITTLNTGQTASINFIIALEIEEYDVALTEIDNIYQTAQNKLNISF